MMVAKKILKKQNEQTATRKFPNFGLVAPSGTCGSF